MTLLLFSFKIQCLCTRNSYLEYFLQSSSFAWCIYVVALRHILVSGSFRLGQLMTLPLFSFKIQGLSATNNRLNDFLRSLSFEVHFPGIAASDPCLGGYVKFTPLFLCITVRHK